MYHTGFGLFDAIRTVWSHGLSCTCWSLGRWGSPREPSLPSHHRTSLGVWVGEVPFLGLYLSSHHVVECLKCLLEVWVGEVNFPFWFCLRNRQNPIQDLFVCYKKVLDGVLYPIDKTPSKTFLYATKRSWMGFCIKLKNVFGSFRFRGMLLKALGFCLLLCSKRFSKHFWKYPKNFWEPFENLWKTF